MKNNKNRKAFTLIELLIVIAIIAVLATVVILSLNPAELLRQARDSNRVSDMATIKSAVALYLADVATPSMGTPGICYASVASLAGNNELNTGGSTIATTTCSLWMASAPTSTYPSSTRGIGGPSSTSAGWIPVAFSAISSGSPIGQEPTDPVDSVGNGNCGTGNLSSCGLFYTYVASSTNFKIAAKMESLKYAYTGSNSSTAVEYSDGGNNVYMYEQGTSLSL